MIDWEYANNAPALFDLAVYAATHKLDPLQSANLLKSYGYEGPVSHLDAYRRVYRVIEVLWWQTINPGEGLLERLQKSAARMP